MSVLRPEAARVVAFLEHIGLETKLVQGAEGFIPYVRIVDGALHYDPQVTASNLLHEAGHLCLIPAQFRPLARDDLSSCGVYDAIEACIRDNGCDPEGPLSRALMQSSDAEATAWAWAAGVHLGLAPEVIILDHEYSGAGRSIRQALKATQWLGINGLAAAGWCARPGPFAGLSPLPVFPAMARWTQPVIEPDLGLLEVGP